MTLHGERQCAENYNKRHDNFFLNRSQYFGNFKRKQYINILGLEMSNPGNLNCMHCIGTFSFPIHRLK